MKRLARTTLYGSIAAGALFMASSPSFAIEPGDFQATLAAVTTGIPLGAAPPPGLYGSLGTFIGGPNAVGTGQNSAAEGANGGRGLNVTGEAILPALVWVPGWNVFGGSAVFAVVQPFYTVAGSQTNCTPVAGVGCVGSEPIMFGAGAGAFFENMHNTIFNNTVSWNWKNGWFTSLGFDFQGPDGSKYNGTLNQDYWTFSPTAAIAFINKDWKLAVNFEYDFHTASQGHTGTFAALQHNVPGPWAPNPNGCVGVACIGNGWTSGDQAFIDWSLEYRWGKLAFGPAGDFKWQTTADTPGAGWTCAGLTAVYGGSLSCGKATDVSLGGIIGYDFGPAELEFYAVDSVYNKDDFNGWKIFTRLSFKLDDPSPKPPAAAPMVGKAH
jgi:hypothetical protein